ncbi:MAG: peptidoglycan-binding protein [Clostridia bacterium]|nr:peptidoglycan-binding protein [Clostridia bacterium]
MTFQNTDRASAISQVQEFLRIIQIADGGDVTVPVDGIYGSATAEAVRQFQRRNGLATTGTVDKATYDLLYEKALEAEFEMSEPLPLYFFPRGRSVSKGEISDFVILIKIILNALTVAYDDFEPLPVNGIFDDDTENAIKLFQMRNKIQPTGIVNKQTWNALVENYNKFGSQNQ